ncbi:MAG: tetraacyldisaccharide 4'-kinase [Chitinophagales bacterium]|nr:tetraacyldisaccharide 4'-kinase [Chitinophagales bacterium]
MPANPFLRILLFPFSLLYGSMIFVRNWLYDSGKFKTVEFDFPTICVGNLSVGGTGKTPHVEYLIRLLSQQFKIATLSRGYLRNSSGYLQVEINTSADAAGDEATMLKKKYQHVAVAVCEERALGVPQLLSAFPQTDVVLLDDGFQHRAVRAGLNIVLSSYDNLFTRDYLLPAGSLREFKNGAERANFIVVTKCPPTLSKEERESIRNEIAPAKNQLVFFSFLQYGQPYLFTDANVRLQFDKSYDVLLVSGIAYNENLKDYLRPQVKNLYSLDFSDHHHFTRVDVEKMIEAFGNIETQQKLLMTTEKDAVRLLSYSNWIFEKKLPIFVQPVIVEFFEEDKQLFDEEVTGWLTKLKSFRNEQADVAEVQNDT